MRAISRDDALPLAGVIIAAFVVFNPWLRQCIDFARQVEARWGLELLTALVILTVMFVFQQHGKYREARALALGAEREARSAQERVKEMEALTGFGRTLARARTVDHVREALWRHLPLLLEGEEAWVLMRAGGRWDVVLDTALDSGPLRIAALEEAAEQACGAKEDPSEAAAADGRGRIVLPLRAAEQLIGVLGLELNNPPLAQHIRRRVPAIAALVAVTLRTAQLFKEISDNSRRDELTGCATRAYGMELANIEISRARRHGHATSVLLMDLDNLKVINDTYGHLAGDAVLAAVGMRLRSSLRCSDIICRYGGDEFLMLLPETSGSAALVVAEWVRQHVRNVKPPPGCETVTVTASIGVAAIPPVPLKGADPVSLRALIERADAALYEAKRKGRDRVEAALETYPDSNPRDLLPAIPQEFRLPAGGGGETPCQPAVESPSH